MVKTSYYYACNNCFLGIVVHRKGCKYLLKKEQAFLGSFYDYSQAMAVAKQRYAETDQCSVCMKFQRDTDVPVTMKPEIKSVSTGSKPDTRSSRIPLPELKAKSASHIKRVPRKHSAANF